MKYSINTTEGDFEPGSNRKVLKNRLQIVREEDMADAEYALLLKLYEHIFEPEFSLATLDFELIKSWHRKWLKPICDWAGELRTVTMSKDGFGPLDYTLWDQHKAFYFKSIQASVAGDNQHMIRLVHDILCS